MTLSESQNPTAKIATLAPAASPKFKQMRLWTWGRDSRLGGWVESVQKMQA